MWDGVRWVSVGSLAVANPNKLINPFMEIDQANEGGVVNTSGTYAIDGWIPVFPAGVLSSNRATGSPPPGYTYDLTTVVSTPSALTASSLAHIAQNIEADELQDTAFGTASARPLTLSFWVRCSIAGVYSVAISNGATNNRSYPFNFTINSANTWQFIQQTVPADTAGTWVINGNAAGMTLRFGLTVGTNYQGTANAWQAGTIIGTSSNTNTWLATANANFSLGPCKLEVGSQATPMLRQSFQQELARCQRYYEKSYSQGIALGATSSAGISLAYLSGPASINAGGNAVAYRVEKRAPPTLTMYSSATGASGHIRDSVNNVDVVPSTNSGTSSFYWTASMSPVSTLLNMSGHWTADARL
jgi:hypothetical protein